MVFNDGQRERLPIFRLFTGLSPVFELTFHLEDRQAILSPRWIKEVL